MKLNPTEIRIDRFYLGPGKGSSLVATYLPTGISAAEKIPAISTETEHAIQTRLLSKLEWKIQEEGKIEEA